MLIIIKDVGSKPTSQLIIIQSVRSNLASRITNRQIFWEQADTASKSWSRWRSKLTSDQVFNIKRERGCWEQVESSISCNRIFESWHRAVVANIRKSLPELKEWTEESFIKIHSPKVAVCYQTRSNHNTIKASIQKDSTLSIPSLYTHKHLVFSIALQPKYPRSLLA